MPPSRPRLTVATMPTAPRSSPTPTAASLTSAPSAARCRRRLSPLQYVTLTSPDGGEVWPAGQTFTIRWRSHDTAGTVDLELRKASDGSLVQTIADDVANTGSYSWTVPGTVTAGESYLIRIVRNDVNLSDTSNAPFTVAGKTSVYYVNDATVDAGDWTTAPGNDASDGLSPATPKASIRALLEAYDLGPGDTILVDAGTYNLTANIIITPDDSGVRITGYHDDANPDRRALIDRKSTATGSYVIELAGADDVTIEQVAITGGQYGLFVDDNSASDRFTLANADVFSNTVYQIYVGSGNADAVIRNNRIHGPISTSYTALYVYSAPRAQILDNEVYASGTGIYASAPSAADHVLIRGNSVHDNTYGIQTNGNDRVTGNTIFRNSSWGIYSAGEVDHNEIFANANGIYNATWAHDNRVYANTGVGIQDGILIERNAIYSNSIGVQMTYYAGYYTGGPTIRNNLIYANSNAGVILSAYYYGTTTSLTNNTIYQPVGDAVRLAGTRYNTLRNNILQVGSGYALSVAADSQVGFDSDYNDFWTTGTGTLVRWQNRDFNSLADWYYEVGQDRHSQVANPGFLDPDGADNVLGFSTGAVGAATVVDDGDAGFSTTGAWTSTTTGFEADSLDAPWDYSPSRTATWEFSGVVPNNFYQFAVSWPARSDLGSQVRYSLYDGDTLVRTVTVDQRVAPADFTADGVGWKVLEAIYALTDRLRVVVDNYYAGGTVIADAARLRPVADGGRDDDFHVSVGSPTIDAGDPLTSAAIEPSPSGGRVNLGHTGNTADATTSPQQLIQVLSPNGLEKLEAGQLATVSWRSQGLSALRPVALVNAGGGQAGYWVPNAYLVSTAGTGTSTYTQAIDTSLVDRPASQAVYQSRIYGYSGLSYLLPVADGTYTVRLHFVEYDATAAGQRTMDIRLQGQTVKTGYDIYAAAGAQFRAVAPSFNVDVTGGQGLAIDLLLRAGSFVTLSGIEVTAAVPGGVTTPTADMQVSTDSGASWTTVASGVAMDAYGFGQTTWTPTIETAGATALVRVVSREAPTVADTSDAPFLITNAGHDYYVNDGSLTGDVFTTAIGDNAASGKNPAHPMASLTALLSAYDLDPGDVVHVDAGTYNLVRNAVFATEDSGVRIVGAGSTLTIFDRGNTSTSSYAIELAGTDDVTIEQVAITGGQYGLFVDDNSASDRFTLANADVFSNTVYQIYVGSGNADAVIRNNRIHGPISTSYTALYVYSAPRAQILDNEVYASGTGIYASAPSAADHVLIRGNSVHDNTYGIQTNGNDRVTGNTIFRNSSWGIYSAGEVDHNEIFANANGIYNATWAHDNRVYANTGVGIQDGILIERNAIYSNSIGVQMTYYAGYYTGGPTIRNNLIYANSNAGVILSAYYYGTTTSLTNNTIYQPVGDAVRLAGTRYNTLRNNILWVESGYDFNVESDSQTGFNTDYNLLNQGADSRAHAGFWNNVVEDTLADWQTATGQEAHGLDGNPGFVDLDGADNVLGYTTARGGYDGGRDDNFYRVKRSVAIDRGDVWSAPPTDIEGFTRRDDPGTPNQGAPDYIETSQASSLFTTSGTAKNWRSDSTYFQLALPFTFPFYESTYTSLYVSTEGFLYFSGPMSAGDGANTQAKLLANRIIAPLWDDLRTNGAGDDIFVDTSVADQVAIRWNATNSADNSDVNFAVTLFASGKVQFHYGAGNTNLTPTVGISRGDGRFYVLSAYDGRTALTNVNSVGFSLSQVNSYVDLGAFEFRGSSLDETPPTVSTVTPSFIASEGTATAAFDTITVGFSEDVNPIDANAAANYELRHAGIDGVFDNDDDLVYSVTASYDPATFVTTLTIALPSGRLPAGSYRFTVFGDDGRGIHDLAGLLLDGDDVANTQSSRFIRSFTIGNLPPVIDPIASKTVAEGTTLTIPVSAHDDDLTDMLTFSLDPGAPDGAAIDSTTGVFAWTPSEAQGPGTYAVTVRVTDSGSPSQSVTTSFTVRVDEVNSPPVLAPIGDRSIDEGSLLTFTASATDADLPLNLLSFSLLGAPAGATIDPVTGVFTWAPTEADGPGSFHFTVRVTDDGTPNRFDDEEVTVTVREVNQAPCSIDYSIGGSNWANRLHSPLPPMTMTPRSTFSGSSWVRTLRPARRSIRSPASSHGRRRRPGLSR